MSQSMLNTFLQIATQIHAFSLSSCECPSLSFDITCGSHFSVEKAENIVDILLISSSNHLQVLWVLLWICCFNYTVPLPCNFTRWSFPCWESSYRFQLPHLKPVGAQLLWQLTGHGFWWYSHAYDSTESWD